MKNKKKLFNCSGNNVEMEKISEEIEEMDKSEKNGKNKNKIENRST